MYFKTVFILIFAFSSDLLESAHTEPGDYKNRIKSELYNPDCGLTTKVNDKVIHKRGNYRTNTHAMSFRNNTEQDYTLSQRIINGFVADIREAPWSAYVYYSKLLGFITSECGGTVLNKKWILTASHCIKDIEGFWDYNGYIYVGSSYKQKGVKYKIDKQFKHPKYNDESCEYDVALIKTKNEIDFKYEHKNYFVNSICLPKNKNKNSKEDSAEFYGWGRIENKTKTDILHKMNVKLRPFNQCKYKCYCYINSPPFHDKPHTAKGDSGSALFQRVGPNNRAVIIGDLCGGDYSSKHFPPTFDHIDWILNTMSQN